MGSDISNLLLLFTKNWAFPRIREGRKKLTWPAIEPSWADLPLTVKVTPLGALDLTSRLARSLLVDVLWMKGDPTNPGWRGRSPCSGAIWRWYQLSILCGSEDFSSIKHRTSLAALAMSEKAAGADMMNMCDERGYSGVEEEEREFGGL